MPPRGLRLPVSRKLCIGTDRLRSVSGGKWCRRDVLEINKYAPDVSAHCFNRNANRTDPDYKIHGSEDKSFGHNVILNSRKSIGLTYFFHSEKYLNLSFPIHSFRDSAGVAQRGGCFQKGLTEMKSSFDRGSLRSFIFAVFRMSYSLHGCVCQRKNQNRMLFLAYTSAQTVRLSKDSKGIANCPGQTHLTFLSKPF